MRITRDLLLSTAKDTVRRYTFGAHDLVCAYVTGSLILEDPLLGGTTDIDLVYVHAIEAPIKREIIPVAEDFHLDIAHLHESIFSQHRELRTNPWIGSFLCHYPIPLFVSGHWFEYTQAGVFAQFYQPSNIIQRVNPFAENARSGWMALQTTEDQFNSSTLSSYLNVLRNAANSISCLTSVPLTNRRFLIDFPSRSEDLKMPGLAGGLVDLIVPEEPIEPDWDVWLADWRTDFKILQNRKNVPLRFINGRMAYYEKAIQGLKDTNQEAALWILLWTWTDITAILSEGREDSLPFRDFCQVLMLGEGHFADRISALDAYLDKVEDTIARWRDLNGA